MDICRSCGACCAAFRVDFHPAERAGGAFVWGEGVPVDLTVAVTAAQVRMLGTDSALPRCAALVGEVGRTVGCSIYDARPSPCREFGVEHQACADARRRHGLPPPAMLIECGAKRGEGHDGQQGGGGGG
jgi:uncharacterized protein